MTNKLQEREMINGKPYGGLWFGKSISSYYIQAEDERDPLYSKCRKILEFWEKEFLPEFEHRHKKIIFKPSFCAEIYSRSSLGIKFMAWGRAYKILRKVCVRIKRYKKVRRAGRLKLVRIDRKYKNP